MDLLSEAENAKEISHTYKREEVQGGRTGQCGSGQERVFLLIQDQDDLVGPGSR